MQYSTIITTESEWNNKEEKRRSEEKEQGRDGRKTDFGFPWRNFDYTTDCTVLPRRAAPSGSWCGIVDKIFAWRLEDISVGAQSTLGGQDIFSTFLSENAWKINKIPKFYTIFARKIFSRIFYGGRGKCPCPISYAYAKDLANIFRTLPGPGEFQELAPPLSQHTTKQTCTAKCCVLHVGLHIQSKNSKT